MKIILSVDLIRFPLTGIGRYTHELAQRLLMSTEIESIKFFSGARLLPELPKASHQNPSVSLLKKIAQQSYFISEVFRLVAPLRRGYALRGTEEHLFHGTNFFLPPFKGKKMATFHDLAVFKMPDCFQPQRARFLQKEFTKTVEAADGLIVPSDYVRQEIANYFSYPLEKVFTTQEACSSVFRKRNKSETAAVLQRYGLSHEGYCLFVGTIEPRKNISSLLRAYAKLPKALRGKYPLVIAGFRGWQSEVIHDEMKRAEMQGWAKYLHYVPGDDLPVLFSGAKIFSFPSLYEGFGLPVLEAMASGVPVVCSNAASLTEVVGDAALISEPTNIDALTDNLAKALQDEDWRSSVIAKGIKRAAEFSWERCAADTIKAYRKTLGQA